MSQYKTTVCNGCDARADGWPEMDMPMPKWGKLTFLDPEHYTSTLHNDYCPKCLEVISTALRGRNKAV